MQARHSAWPSFRGYRCNELEYYRRLAYTGADFFWQILRRIYDQKFVITQLWRTYDDANFGKILWRFYDHLLIFRKSGPWLVTCQLGKLGLTLARSKVKGRTSRSVPKSSPSSLDLGEGWRKMIAYKNEEVLCVGTVDNSCTGKATG